MHQGGQGTLDGNEIFDNLDYGMKVVGNGAPVVNNNNIHHNRSGPGILVCDKGFGQYTRNKIESLCARINNANLIVM